MNCPEGGCFTFQFLPISRQEQNGRVIRFAERWGGEGLVCIPEGGVTMVECTISTRVDGDMLKVFWSYCSEVGFVKVPRDNKSCIWVRGFLPTYIPVQFLECLVCVGLGGVYKQPWLLGVDRYVFFRADTDNDYYRSSRPITDILNRYTCLV